MVYMDNKMSYLVQVPFPYQMFQNLAPNLKNNNNISSQRSHRIRDNKNALPEPYSQADHATF